MPISLEIEWDSLHMKLLALIVVFTSLNFAPLRSRNSLYGGIIFGYPLQNTRIRPFKWQHPHEIVAASGVPECIVPTVSCWDR